MNVVSTAWKRFRSLRLRWQITIGVIVFFLILAPFAGGSSDDDEPAGADNSDSSPGAGETPSGVGDTATARATATPQATDTPEPTNTPEPTATTAPPTPTPEPSGFSFGSGPKIVGTEVIAGAIYRTETASRGCYWERLSGFGGTLDEIEANDNSNGYAVVTIGTGDVGFNSARCGRWSQDLSAVTDDPAAPFTGDGTYIVNVDIAPGTWRADATELCYWARLSGFSGTLSDIIANGNDPGPIITIAASDAGLQTSRCGTFTKIQ